jgi:hypothetical protein
MRNYGCCTSTYSIIFIDTIYMPYHVARCGKWTAKVTHTQLPLGFPVPERQEWGDDEHDDMTSPPFSMFYPLGIWQLAIENGHRISWFTYETCGFCQGKLLVYQRVPAKLAKHPKGLPMRRDPGMLLWHIHLSKVVERGHAFIGKHAIWWGSKSVCMQSSA